jgi:hypothetical protein
MGRIFALITFICLVAIMIMGVVLPNDPLFLFAAKGPAALLLRGFLALMMYKLAFGFPLQNAKLRSYLGLAGFLLITFSVMTLGATQGGGIYPYLQPADLLTAIIVGITSSIATLEATPATTPVAQDKRLIYQALEEEPRPPKGIKATPRHRPA